MVKQTNEGIGASKRDWGEAYPSPGPVAPRGYWSKCELLQRAEKRIKVDAPQKVTDIAQSPFPTPPDRIRAGHIWAILELMEENKRACRMIRSKMNV